LKNLLIPLVTFVFSHLIYKSAFAWQIMTPASEPCHESMILAAFGETKLSETTSKIAEISELKADILQQIREIGIPESRENKKFMDEIVDQFDLRDRSPEEIWFYASLIAGVRFPDTRGFATFKAHESRMTHLSDDAQSIHTLRSKSDDGNEGDASALAATKKLILEHARQSHERYYSKNNEIRKVYSVWTFPFYGDNVAVTVHAPLYLLAMSAHSIQDSYSHTLRNEAWEVVSVANYIDLVSNRRNTRRDGLGHSDRLDECKLHTSFDRERFQKAVDATTDFVLATHETWKQETFRSEGIEKVLSEIYKFHPGCTDENAYCQSPWLPFANEQITKALRLKPECGVIGSRLKFEDNTQIKSSSWISIFSLVLLLLPLIIPICYVYSKRLKLWMIAGASLFSFNSDGKN